MRIAGPHGDDAGLHVAEIDVPAIGAVGGSAAGKVRGLGHGRFGHPSIQARAGELGKHARQLRLLTPAVAAYSRGWK